MSVGLVGGPARHAARCSPLGLTACCRHTTGTTLHVSTKFLCRTRGFVPTGDGMSDRKALGFDSISIAASAHSRYAYSNTEHPLRDTTLNASAALVHTVAATGTATARRQKRSEQAVKAQTVTQTDRATPTATAWRRLRRAVIRSVKQAAEHWRRPDAKTCVR